MNSTKQNRETTMEPTQYVMPLEPVQSSREHYRDQRGIVQGPIHDDTTHVMVFWPDMGVTSCWAVMELTLYRK